VIIVIVGESRTLAPRRSQTGFLQLACVRRTTWPIHDVTHILDAIRSGHPQAAEELLPVVYEELRRLAAAKMAQQAPGQTLQATALVHEAWLRLAGKPGASDEARFQDRQHFFRAAAEAMRHILIDRARRRQRVRHGENPGHVPLDDVEIVAPEKEEILLHLDDALADLTAASPERAEIVKLRFFAGLNEVQIAEILGLSPRSVQRHWTYARAWLFARIEASKKA
jgi:RNA polymerase sigma factor (TIGR02999 family)